MLKHETLRNGTLGTNMGLVKFDANGYADNVDKYLEEYLSKLIDEVSIVKDKPKPKSKKETEAKVSKAPVKKEAPKAVVKKVEKKKVPAKKAASKSSAKETTKKKGTKSTK